MNKEKIEPASKRRGIDHIKHARMPNGTVVNIRRLDDTDVQKIVRAAEPSINRYVFRRGNTYHAIENIINGEALQFIFILSSRTHTLPAPWIKAFENDPKQILKLTHLIAYKKRVYWNNMTKTLFIEAFLNSVPPPIMTLLKNEDELACDN